MSSTSVEQKASYANKKFHGFDFSGQHLAHADFRCGSFIDCNFSGADLSYANCEGANFFGSDFTNARLYRTNFKDAQLAQTIMKPKECSGVTVTLECCNFDRMKIGKFWWFVWLMLATIMEAPDLTVLNGLTEAIGKERFEHLKQLFDTRSQA